MMHDVKKKTTLILFFLIVLISHAHAAIDVANGSFETGDFTFWTIQTGTDLDRRGITIDGNTLVGVIETYDMNVQDGSFAVFAYEHKNCAPVSACHIDVTVTAGDELVAGLELTRGGLGGSQRVAQVQECGTVPAGVTNQPLKFNISYLNSATVERDVNFTHTTQTLDTGDVVCFFGEGDGDASGGNVEGVVTVDNFQLISHTLTVTEPVEPIASLNSFEVRATVQDLNGDFIETADVNITLNGDTNAMVFSSGAYRITFPNGLTSGTFPFDVNSSFESVEKGFSGSLIFAPDFRESLIVTNINNTSISVDSNTVNVIHSVFNKETKPAFAYQVENTINEAIIVNYSARGKKADVQKNPTRTFLIFTDDTESQDFKLNDSLTFSINRIWNPTIEEYEHQFERNLGVSATQQFKLDYKRPLISFDSLTDQDFFTVQGSVKKIDLDNRFIDEISINKFTRLVLTPTPDFAIITSSDTPHSSYVVSFTASVDSGTLEISSQGDTETITTIPQTIYLDVNGFFQIVTEQPTGFRKLQIENFVVMERGFFANELEVFDEFGNDLPIIIDDLNNAFQVLEEGQNFTVKTQVYERGLFENQDLNVIIIDAFVYGIEDQNTLIRKEIQIKQEDFVNEITIDIDELMEGIITTSIDLPTLTPLVVRVRACGKRVDTDATSEPICYAIQETQNLILRQFPFSNSQIQISLTIDDFFIGENPEGSLFLETDFIENIEYIVLTVFNESNTVTNPDVNETFYKNKDFQCFADFCDFDFRLPEWGFESAINYFIQATIKVKTSDLDYNNELLNQIDFLQAFHIGYKERFVNLYNVSRDARIFKDFEKLPILINLRDNLNLPSRDDLNVNIRVWDLGTSDFNGGGDAEIIFDPIVFSWDVYRYDINKGINRYAFIGRLRESDSALQDGHFYRVLVEINDHTKKREQINPITLSANKSTGGWNSDSNAFQQENEVSIKIDNAITLDAPLADQNGLRSLTCIDPQTHKAETLLRIDALSLSIDSATSSSNLAILGFILKGGIRFGSSLLNELFYKDCHLTWIDRAHHVDSIRIYVYNSYSDLTEQNPAFKQYMDFTIGEELIIFNDGKQAINDLIQRSPSQCKTSFNDDTLGRLSCSLTALGNNQAEEIITLGHDVFDFLTNGSDINSIETINPSTRYLKFQIDNIKPKNVLDFEEVAQIDFSNIPDTKILQHLVKDKGLRTVNDEPARVTIFQNNIKIKTIELPNNLYDRIEFDQYADQNGLTTSNFDYFLRVDLCYNSGRNCLDPQILKFTDKVFLKKPNKPFSVLLGGCVANAEQFSACILSFFTTPEVFIVVFGGILIVLIIIFVFVMVKSPKARAGAGELLTIIAERARKPPKKPPLGGAS